MNIIVKKEIFPVPAKLAENFAEEFGGICDEIISRKNSVDIALSGGNTPKLFFSVLAKDYISKIDWSKLNFYWVDERCVPSNSNESNYGEADRIFFKNISGKKNIYPIDGTMDPEDEALEYSRLLQKNLTIKNSLPQFDLLLLGMGDDGHTASIFPDQMELLNSSKICAVATHPASGQKRITLTGPVINNAELVIFVVTGSDKAPVIRQIFEKENNYQKYPAAHVSPLSKQLQWILDEAAAQLLKEK